MRGMYRRQGLRNWLIESFLKILATFRIGFYNKVAYIVAAKHTYGRRTRVTELQWHYVSDRDQVEKRIVVLNKLKVRPT